MTFTPEQEFLVRWTREGRMVTEVMRARCMTKHGPRGLRRAARKARRNAHARRLQRVTWCSHFEQLKRAA